jgi:hypothetical protein
MRAIQSEGFRNKKDFYLTMTTAPGRQRLYGLCVVLLGCLFFAVRGYHDQTLALQSFDFKPVYSSARCLLDGCDPYDSIQIERVYLQHGGDASDLRPFRPFNANYPPSALFLVMPLTLLPFGPAHVLWLGIGIFFFCVAAFCIADLCAGPRALLVEGILAVFVATSTILVMLGQPAMISISLVVIGAWCFLKQRHTVIGILAFAASLTFKPHVGALIWLFFLLTSRGGELPGSVSALSGETSLEPATMFRRRALQTLAVTLVLMTPGIWLAFHHPASAHWPRELRTNLVGIAAHGNASDPGPANDEAASIDNLQALFSLVRDRPSFYNRAAYAAFVPLFLAWLYLVMRSLKNPYRRLFGEEGLTVIAARNLLALATAAALSFLPIYHRQYDTRLLLFLFPAVALMASRKRWQGYVALGLSIMATFTMSHQFVHLGPWAGRHVASLPPVVWLALYRPLPLTLLLLTVFFLYCMFRLALEERQA